MTRCSPDENNDVAIIGAGPAGLAAALYCARAGLKTILYGDPYSSQLAKADTVENYLTIKNGKGLEIIEKMIDHATNVGAKLVDKQIKQITVADNGVYSMFDEDGNSDCAHAVILATGTKHKKLGVKGEEKYYAKGVSYCTICDGPIYRGQSIAIVGFGDQAVQAALRMTTIASEVYMVSTKARLGADPALVKELDASPNATIIENTRPLEIMGNGSVTGLKYKHSGMEQEISVNAAFIEVGVLPSSAIASGVGVELDGSFIKVNRDQSTNIPGFFAAGDITGGMARQAIISAGDGARAAITAMDFIKRIGVSMSKIKTTQWGGTKATKTSETQTSIVAETIGGPLKEYISRDEGFLSGYNRYEPKLEVIANVIDRMKEAKLTIISAHWCPDCRRNVPKIAKILDHLPWDVEVRDRDEEGVVDQFNIKKIPTFIVSDKDGNELNRIIENPKYSSLEEDLLAICERRY
ncbi:MAG: NADH dehydrogenase [Candidatus Heimdallarchaeota archaeon LC_2]|nr:MAG: NADH dehydrogenase [Candidatus Heimdallarchaeota archaeon LC_2]